MTTPITKELREHTEENVKALRLAVKQHAFKDIRDAIEMDLKVAEFALAAMDAEPVAWTDEQELRDVERSGCGYLFTCNPVTPHADERRVIKLYTAPPAPVSVPDEVIVLLNHLEDVLPDDAFNLIDVKTWNNVSMLSRPDVYRAAMLQAGNSLAIPDGWQLVPVIAFPSQWAAGQKALISAGINKVDAVYKAMVAAAPQQEGK